MMTLLRATTPKEPGNKRVAQQLRQVALCVRAAATAAEGKGGGGADTELCAAAAPWLTRVKRSVFFGQQRGAQERVLRLWQRRLAERGAHFEVGAVTSSNTRRAATAQDVLRIWPLDHDGGSNNSSCRVAVASAAAPDHTPRVEGGRVPTSAAVGSSEATTGSQGRPGSSLADACVDHRHGPALVTVWVKHPLLLIAAEEDPVAAEGGAADGGCCLNGFELLEKAAGEALGSRVVFVRSNMEPSEVSSMVDRFLDTPSTPAARPLG
eukprot:NODE_8604_length_1483_cov_2.148968.p1 GENE.NODE_8604_length_1483_cov_2.148968~~NODE_8604_length_1483_cov_2.148968.p1  ORF type:complete len:266 (+),score=67.25 NODE_8604_length_1483_cov_2.148968:419-1216(+)